MHFKHHWVTVPLNLRLMPLKRPTIFVDAGVFAALIAAQTGEGQAYDRFFSSGQLEPTEHFPDWRTTEPMVVGLSGGLAVNVPLGSVLLFFKPEYRHGLSYLLNVPVRIPHHYVRMIVGLRF